MKEGRREEAPQRGRKEGVTGRKEEREGWKRAHSALGGVGFGGPGVLTSCPAGRQSYAGSCR